jgi:hypothetical protein
MTALFRTLLAGALLATAAAPASARLASDDPEKVTVTFRLTVYGDPSTSEYFRGTGETYSIYIQPGREADPIIRVLCGAYVGGPVERPCAGGGASYSESVRLPRGVRMWYGYSVGYRQMSAMDFVEGERVARADMTIAAYDDYRTGKSGHGDGTAGEGPPSLPDTGRGALAGTQVARAPAGWSLPPSPGGEFDPGPWPLR